MKRLPSLLRTLLCLLVPAWATFGVASDGAPEYELKAAFVFNFIQFTDWPEGQPADTTTLAICANPAAAPYGALAALAGKSAHGRKIVIKHLQDEQARQCQVVFLAAADRERLPQIRKNLAGGSALIIGDSPEVNREGVTIALTVVGGKIIFDIDASAARRANLSISSRLLRLARSVQ